MLFEAVGSSNGNECEDQKHLAYIAALLGPPPIELLDRGVRSSTFFNAGREYKLSGGTYVSVLMHFLGLTNPGIGPEIFTFESTLNHVTGEEKSDFIKFVKRMLKWLPEERNTAAELLNDPWLHTDYSES